MRLSRRKLGRDDESYKARLAEANAAVAESKESLVKADEMAGDTAAIADRLRSELHKNHFAPALAEAIARSIR